MVGLSSAVLWWGEWQLRILVLSSLFVQWLLLLFASLRKLAIPSWFRSMIWLAYIGSDALAIYALAVLFGHERRQDCDSGQRNSVLEVKRREYMQKARAFVQADPCHQAQEGDAADLEANNHVPDQAQGEDDVVDLEPDHGSQTPSTRTSRGQVDYYNVDLEAYKLFLDLASPYPDRLGILKSFGLLHEIQAYVLLQNRLSNTFNLLYTEKNTTELCDETGEKPDMNPGALFIRLPANIPPWAALALFHNSHREAYDGNDVKVTYVLFCCTAVLEYFCMCFSTEHISSKDQRQVHSSSRAPDGDWAVQFVTKVLDQVARIKLENAQWRGSEVPPFQWRRTILYKLQWARKKVALSLQWARKKVAPSITELGNVIRIGALKDSLVGQYALVGFFVHNKKHTKMTSILSSLNCNDFFLPTLVHEALQLFLCNNRISPQITNVPLLSVLKMHQVKAMVVLFGVKDLIIMAGSAHHHTTNAELEEILKDDDPSLEKILKGDEPSLMEILGCNKPFLKFFTGRKPLLNEIEREFTQRIISKKIEHGMERVPAFPEESGRMLLAQAGISGLVNAEQAFGHYALQPFNIKFYWI
ncbi:hypothetical protein VPH35_016026 [Triticum aestivum]|uniref:DUF4220 domain-containing protein n=1 Tax=Aegilops tauschii TaxID=37682 RepID=M8BEZ6_AEGTA